MKNVEELRDWLKERELVLCSHGGDASMRVIYSPPPCVPHQTDTHPPHLSLTPQCRRPESGSKIGLEFGPGVFLQWLRTSTDSPFPRVRLLLYVTTTYCRSVIIYRSGAPADMHTLANFADHLTTVTCQPQVVRSFAAWEKIIA